MSREWHFYVVEMKTIALISTIVLIAVSWGFPTSCFAGRPVIQTVSFGELVEKAESIAIVTKASLFNFKDNRSGCDKLSWRVKVKTVLKQGSQQLPTSSLKVHHNITSFQDCTIRQSNPSGVSFGSRSYQPSDPEIVKKDNEFIVFLTAHNGQFELIIDNAVESVDKHQELKKILKQLSR